MSLYGKNLWSEVARQGRTAGTRALAHCRLLGYEGRYCWEGDDDAFPISSSKVTPVSPCSAQKSQSWGEHNAGCKQAD